MRRWSERDDHHHHHHVATPIQAFLSTEQGSQNSALYQVTSLRDPATPGGGAAVLHRSLCFSLCSCLERACPVSEKSSTMLQEAKQAHRSSNTSLSCSLECLGMGFQGTTLQTTCIVVCGRRPGLNRKIHACLWRGV